MESFLKTSLKKCNTCNTTKLVSFFPKNKGSKDGYGSKCKHCLKKYYVENREHIRLKDNIYFKKYYTEKKETIQKNSRKLYRSYTPGIYHVFTEDGDYIGQSNAIEARIANHKWTGKKGGYGKFPIKSKVVSWKILEVVEDTKERLEREHYYINKLQPTINNKP